MGHDHHDVDLTDRRMKLAIVLTVGFVAAEALAGWKAGSLALLSDAGHNLTDAMALGLSAFAVWIAHRPATERRTFGYHRVGILTALVNAVTLVLMCGLIVVEAVHRLRQPEPVASAWMIGVALIALVLNGTITLMFRKAAHGDINVRSAYLHMLWDAVASLGVILAGVIVSLTGNVIADPLVSLLIAALILWSTWGILRESLDILLEATPTGVELATLESTIRGVAGVCDVHDLHVWTISSGILAASCHVTVAEGTSARTGQALAEEVGRSLETRFGITHTTVQVEVDGCERSDRLCTLRRNGVQPNGEQVAPTKP